MGGVEGGVGQSEHTNIVAKKSLTLSDATDYYQYQYLGNCPPTPPPHPTLTLTCHQLTVVRLGEG